MAIEAFDPRGSIDDWKKDNAGRGEVVWTNSRSGGTPKAVPFGLPLGSLVGRYAVGYGDRGVFLSFPIQNPRVTLSV